MVGPKVAASSAMKALEVLCAGSTTAVHVSSSAALPPSDVIEASSVALDAAGARAEVLARQEERELQLLCASALDVQACKIESKIKYLGDLSLALASGHFSLAEQQRLLARE